MTVWKINFKRCNDDILHTTAFIISMCLCVQLTLTILKLTPDRRPWRSTLLTNMKSEKIYH